MTEDQQGGTVPEPEAIASADVPMQSSVAATAVADEPAIPDMTTSGPEAEEGVEAPESSAGTATPAGEADASESISTQSDGRGTCGR